MTRHVTKEHDTQSCVKQIDIL